ncbi:hypothetical protein EON80_20005 [bacterium]|nr:MAG: hypothetical protein EON80_20005 [bacterium]
MKRQLLALSLLFLAGCEQTKPPTPEGLKKIEARTAEGTVFTKLEARSQPEKPLAGQVSIWDLKVFDIKDKPDRTRAEWKFFNPLPQSAGAPNTTDVLMKAWIISRDGSVFLPAVPSYKAYGSFVTDWSLPRPGAYSLFVEYHPAKSGTPKSSISVEMASWNFTAEAGPSKEKILPSKPSWSASLNPAPITLNGSPEGEPAGALSLEGLPTKAGEVTDVTVKGAPAGAAGMELAALSAGGHFQHFTADSRGIFEVSFPKSSMVRIWAYFTLNGAPYAAPLNHFVN